MESPDKILWLGPYAVGDYFKLLLDEGTYIQTAANRVQGFYINELYEQMRIPIDVISALITIPFPKSPRKRLFSSVTSVSNHISIYNVPYINVPYISVLSQKVQLERKIIEWIHENQNKSVWVIVYSMRLPLLQCAELIKRRMNNVKVVNIIPDLPQYMHENCSVIRRIALRYYLKKIKDVQKCVDLFSLYTESMKEYIPCQGKSTVVIEGLFSNPYPDMVPKKKEKRDKKIVVYAGILNEQYGVATLVESFRYLSNEAIELHLYGQGDYLSRLNNVIQEYSNVKYMGLVSPEVAYEKICDADLLVNPRPSEPEYTKYSFPSKTFEYMASGTPVLMTKLPGIPDDYYKFVHIIKKETPEGIADSIKKVFDQDPNMIEQKALAAKKFILEEKSSEKQVNRLVDGIKNL